MFAIFKREVRSCFHGMIGYVLTAFLLVASAIYFVALNLGYGLPDFGYYTLYNTIFMLLFYFPVLTMRSFAEERRTRTDQLLLTSPVPVTGIVLGKFFALCVVFVLPCVVDAVMILTLWALGVDLRKKGITAETLERVFEEYEYEEDDILEEQVKKRIRQKGAVTKENFQKYYGYFARKGFNSGKILDLLRKYMED